MITKNSIKNNLIDSTIILSNLNVLMTKTESGNYEWSVSMFNNTSNIMFDVLVDNKYIDEFINVLEVYNDENRIINDNLLKVFNYDDIRKVIWSIKDFDVILSFRSSIEEYDASGYDHCLTGIEFYRKDGFRASISFNPDENYPMTRFLFELYNDLRIAKVIFQK